MILDKIISCLRKRDIEGVKELLESPSYIKNRAFEVKCAFLSKALKDSPDKVKTLLLFRQICRVDFNSKEFYMNVARTSAVLAYNLGEEWRANNGDFFKGVEKFSIFALKFCTQYPDELTEWETFVSRMGYSDWEEMVVGECRKWLESEKKKEVEKYLQR